MIGLGYSHWVRGCAALVVWSGWQLQVALAEDFSKLPAEPKTSHVVIVKDPAATSAFVPQPDRIQAMVDRGISLLTGKNDVSNAWMTVVSTRDVVGIRVDSVPGATSGTRPAVVEGIVNGLLRAGIPANHIIIWDKRLSDLRRAGYIDLANRLHVRVAGSADEGYDSKTFYERALLGQLIWGDSEFGHKGDGVGRKSFVSKLITQEITKIIQVTPLLNHSRAGVDGNLYGLTSCSVDNFHRFETSNGQLVEAVPEIYALPALGDRVALNIVDALICQYQGDQSTLLQYSVALNQLRFSTDPVALDVLSIQELDRQRESAKIQSAKSSLELYHNASLLELGFCDEHQFLVETAQMQ